MLSADQLRKLKIFKESAPAALDRLAKDMVEKIYAPGDVILKEGEASGALYLIAAGSVSVQKQIEGDRAKVVARLEGEEFFGEMSFLENQPHSATIVAQEETRIFLLPRTVLNDLIQKDAKMALDQVLTLLSGVSSRLRRTTRELVSVFETARFVGQSLSLSDLMEKIIAQLRSDLGEAVTVGFYRWNLFNDEYDLLKAQGPHQSSLAPALEPKSLLLADVEEGKLKSWGDLTQRISPPTPLSFKRGHLLVSRVDMLNAKQGVFVYYSEAPAAFDPGERQLIETISAVLAPALETARAREEEGARQRLQRGKEERYFV
jgi:CRP-like cAMP-binding protein